MTPDELRTYGHAVVDWVADYLATLESRPVLSPVQPGEIRAALPERPPERPEPFDAVLADLDRLVLPGITHWQSPSFFAYFPASSSGPSILGELLSAGLGVQGMLWATSPAATEVETHVMDWLVELLGLPPAFRSDSTGGGVIQDSASSSSLVAMLAARERATGGRSNADGLTGAGRRLVAYASTQAHSSIEKAARIAGIGSAGLRLVDVDEATQQLRPDELERLMAADAAAGATPFFVAATVGTTSTTAIDPVRAIGEICRRHGAWLHVDAAHAGAAAVCPELRWVNDGVELADSYVVDAHKWLLTNFDCSAFFVADRRALITALSILPEYLRNAASESGAVIDYRDWMVPLGRRFRALKLWLVLRWYGAEGLRHHVRRHVGLARELSDWVDADPSFERVATTTVNLVCFRHVGGDELTERLLGELNRSGTMFLTHTRVGGRYALRMAVGSVATEHRHVELAWERIRATAAALVVEGAGTG
ncbi:MAG: pyridoxal-dependent decarboxylase [Frankiaceae bacterium]